MYDLRKPEHLALAEEHIREGRARVRQQIALIRVLRAEVQPQQEEQALRLLAALRESVKITRQHRSLIERVLGGWEGLWPRPSGCQASSTAERERDQPG